MAISALFSQAPTTDTCIRRLTPAGLEHRSVLRARRLLFAGLLLTSMAVLITAVARVFSAGGWSASDLLIVICFVIAAPRTVMGLWYSAIGFWLLYGRKNGVALAAPHLAMTTDSSPVRSTKPISS